MHPKTEYFKPIIFSIEPFSLIIFTYMIVKHIYKNLRHQLKSIIAEYERYKQLNKMMVM